MSRKKKNKSKNRNKVATRKPKKLANVVQFPTKQALGEGILWRDYPPEDERIRLINRILKTPEGERSANQWWKLGDYTVLNGFLDEDDVLINKGLEALMRGANLPKPSAACLLDLGWVLMFRRLDSMAIPHIAHATELFPESRDAWVLLALAYLGANQPQLAISALRNAIGLPNATEADRDLLQRINNGEDPLELRRKMGLHKLDIEDLASGDYGEKESQKVAVLYYKSLLEHDPENVDLLLGYSQARYLLGQYELAQPLLNQLLEIEPENADAHSILALIASKSGDMERAIEHYRLALSINADHMLSLTNLASALQENGEYYEARTYLDTALNQDNQQSYLYPIALDLYGSNVGVIEEDYDKEVELHRTALDKSPNNMYFTANLVVALISSDQANEAKRIWNKELERLATLPNSNVLSMLVESATNKKEHPAGYLELVSHMHSSLGWKAMRVYINNAWRNRNKVNQEDQFSFLNTIGMYAAHSGDHELALEIWRTGFSLPEGDAFRVNYAVELSNANRFEEALEFLDTVPMNQPRSWTVRGNIKRGTNDLEGALEDYTQALESDEPFLLPISNGIEMAVAIGSPDSTAPFVEALINGWKDDRAGLLILARAYLYQGRAESAFNVFRNVLFEKKKFLTPEELGSEISDQDDLSQFGGSAIYPYYSYALSCIKARHYSEFLDLYQKVSSWPKWFDGNWIVLDAEVKRLEKDRVQSIEIAEAMSVQPPPLMTMALCNIGDGEYATAEGLALQVLQDEEQAANYQHPEGRPDALANAIVAIVKLNAGDDETAAAYARKGVLADPSCALAVIALSEYLLSQGESEEQVTVIEKGLHILPGNPSLLEHYVETLLEHGDPKRADKILRKHRDLLCEQGEELLSSQLGEMVALGQLEADNYKGYTDVNFDSYSWSSQLDSLSQRWLKGAVISGLESENLLAAEAMYLCKIAERELVLRVIQPFRDQLDINNVKLPNKMMRDLSFYLSGKGRPPSLGGITKALELAAKTSQVDDGGLISLWRDYLDYILKEKSIGVIETEFIDHLSVLANLRNRIAHIGEPSVQDYIEMRKFMLLDTKPGPFFLTLGVSN